MVACPVPCSVASPGVTPVNTATLWLEEVNVVSEVTSVPLLVALNCAEPVERLTVGLLGERTRLLALVPTVRVAEPLTVPSVAVMVVVPIFTPLARPPVEMVATVVSELLQTRLCSEPEQRQHASIRHQPGLHAPDGLSASIVSGRAARILANQGGGKAAAGRLA